MNDEPRVLAVFDANTREVDVYRGWPPLMDWIREHNATPRVVRRFEVLLLDAPFVRFYEYDEDAAGRKYLDPATGSAATLPPRDVVLRRMPPEHERRPLPR